MVEEAPDTRTREDFNPRSPCGERLWKYMDAQKNQIFQSTLPVWGATTYLERYRKAAAISIHAPRVGSDFIFPVV